MRHRSEIRKWQQNVGFVKRFSIPIPKRWMAKDVPRPPHPKVTKNIRKKQAMWITFFVQFFPHFVRRI
jgi:hypothetical protein